MIPVEFVAVVVVVTEPAPWHLVDITGENALMVTVGVMVTVLIT